MKHYKFFKFLEKKDHLINKLEGLTLEQKEKAIAFFNKHPDYESEIDWNKKNLTWEDFDNVINKIRDTKSQIKKAVKKGIKGIEEGVDYEDLGSCVLPIIGKVHAYIPLTWKGSRVLASDQVEPRLSTSKEGYTGAKWCISYQKTDQYWEDYSEGNYFLFIFGSNVPTKKLAIQVDVKDTEVSYPTIWDSDDDTVEHYSEYSVADFEDESVLVTLNKAGILDILKNSSIIENFKKFTEKIRLEKYSLKMDKFNKWVADHTNPATGLVDINDDVYIDGMYGGENTLDDDFQDILVLNGKLTIKFGNVSGNFFCTAMHLRSLEGIPEYVGGDLCLDNNYLETIDHFPSYVGGDVSINFNSLTSLEGCLETIQDNFSCNNNPLENLKGGPREVKSSYFCMGCNLKSLEGSPEKVGKDFACTDNHISSLKSCPSYIGRNFDIRYNRLRSLDLGTSDRQVYVGNYIFARGNYIERDEYLEEDSPKDISGLKFSGLVLTN